MSEIEEIQDMPTYKTLDEIRLRKAQLLTDITKDSNHINTLWNNLFHPKKDAGKKSAGKRMSSIVSTGANVIDGLILGWKLYKKFKR